MLLILSRVGFVCFYKHLVGVSEMVFSVIRLEISTSRDTRAREAQWPTCRELVELA